ncbi:MAG: MFS transporter [Thermoprotei archaeon]
MAFSRVLRSEGYERAMTTNRNIRRIALLGTFRTFPTALVGPFTGLVLYIRGMPMAYVSLYYALLAALSALGQLTGGLLSDRNGRKRTMLAGQMMSSLFLFIMGIGLMFPGYLLFSIAALVQSFFGSVSFSAYNTYIGDIGVSKEGLVTSYGIARMGINMGWALGPLVGGFLLQTVGYSSTFMLAGILIGAATLLFIGLEEPVKRADFDLSALKDGHYVLSILPFVLVFAFIAQFGLTLTVFENAVNKFSFLDLGLFYLVNGLTVVICQYPISRFLAPRDPIKWVNVGLAFYGLSYVMLAFTRGLYGVMLSVFILTIGEDISTPLFMTIANLLARPEKRGSYMGIYGVVSSSARSLGSSIGGALMSRFLYSPLKLWGSVDGMGAISALGTQLVTGRSLRRKLDINRPQRKASSVAQLQTSHLKPLARISL